jgi:hypothetical protein
MLLEMDGRVSTSSSRSDAEERVMSEMTKDEDVEAPIRSE